MKWLTIRDRVQFLYDDHERIVAGVVQPVGSNDYSAKVWAHDPYRSVTEWTVFETPDEAEAWAVAMVRMGDAP